MAFIKIMINLMALLLIPAQTVLGTVSPEESTEQKAFVAWAKNQAIPIRTVEPGGSVEDLAPLAAVIGNARVVCLGETRHDASEQFRFKHRLIRFLVEKMNFTLFALEESIHSTRAINAYLLRGEGRAEDVVHGMGAWYIWDTEEVVSLMKWLRTYNENPDHAKKVRFFGMDITEPFAGIEQITGYLEQVDPDHAAALAKAPPEWDLFSKDMWSGTMANYTRATAEQREALGTSLKSLVTRFEKNRSPYTARSSKGEYELILRQVLALEKGHALFIAWMSSTFEEAGAIREKAMYRNLRWILDHAGKGERLVVWAHNLHVARDSFDLDIANRPPAKGLIPMTHFLSMDLGINLVSMGFAFHTSTCTASPALPAPEGSVDEALAAVGPARFVLDLRTAPREGPVHDWLHADQVMRQQGGTSLLIPAASYDLLFYVKEVSSTQRTSRAQARFQTLDGN